MGHLSARLVTKPPRVTKLGRPTSARAPRRKDQKSKGIKQICPACGGSIVLYKLKVSDPHHDSIRLVRYESHQLDCPECYIELRCDPQRSGPAR